MPIDIFHKTKKIIWILLIFSRLFSEKEVSEIKSLTIIGNDHISNNAILFLLRQKPPNLFFKKPKFEPRLVKLDALTIKNYYHSKGFLDVKIKESFKTSLGYTDINFEINAK